MVIKLCRKYCRFTSVLAASVALLLLTSIISYCAVNCFPQEKVSCCPEDDAKCCCCSDKNESVNTELECVCSIKENGADAAVEFPATAENSISKIFSNFINAYNYSESIAKYNPQKSLDFSINSVNYSTGIYIELANLRI